MTISRVKHHQAAASVVQSEPPRSSVSDQDMWCAPRLRGVLWWKTSTGHSCRNVCAPLHVSAVWTWTSWMSWISNDLHFSIICLQSNHLSVSTRRIAKSLIKDTGEIMHLINLLLKKKSMKTSAAFC